MNIKLIKEQYPGLQKWGDNQALELYKKIQEHQLIKEFLYTVDPLKTFNQIQKQLGYNIVYADWGKRKGKIVKINLTFRDQLKNNIQKINELMNTFGWYPSYIDEVDGGKYSSVVSKFLDLKNITVIYEAKYDQEIDTSKIKYIYHLTPDLKWPKIKSLGLTPKTQGKLGDHPGRIYFMSNIDNLEDFGGDITDVAFNLLNSYEYKDKVKEMYLLKIDISKLKNIKFFEDPNFFMGDAIWTYQNIPPNVIQIENKINVTY